MKFNSCKGAEACAFLLGLHGSPMKYIDLLRILYAADFRALKSTGQVISGTSVNLDSPWVKIIQTKEEIRVTLLQDIGRENLSKEEEIILKDSYTDYINNTEAFPSFDSEEIKTIVETSTRETYFDMMTSLNRKPKISISSICKNYSRKVKL